MTIRASAILIGFAIVLVFAGSVQAQGHERGIKVFTDSKCSLCHSIAGKGNAKGPIDDVGSKLSAAEIREWLVNPEAMRQKSKAERKPVMKSFSTMPKDDLDALVAYLQTLKKK